ncbi:hypothetical protein ACMAZD_12215 [Vibrio sp. nBUS_14]|uniref:hypothetical protein n=1 Tax=Vibrio sp. nBUS_14 TaxID=3395321 RepID=UPI003EBF43B4
MKISRLTESENCIQNGDVVYIYDHAHHLWESADKYLEPSDQYIKGTNELPVGENGLFIIEMDTFEFSDWESSLTYK